MLHPAATPPGDLGSAPPAALSIRGFTKTYAGGFTAVRDLDLDVPAGSFFGLLGPNGAGKTTMIGSVCNLVRPTAGQISVFGHDHESREARRLVGLAEQDINLDRFLNVEEVLVYHAGFFGMGRRQAKARAAELMEVFDLTSKASTRSPALSGGMRRRLLFARALMHHPKLLILDEPTAGVDVELRTELWEYTRRLHQEGTTVLLTTHYLEEAEALCEEIALLRGGQIIARDTADGLRAQFGATDIAGVYLKAMAAAGVSEEAAAAELGDAEGAVAATAGGAR
jgi:ABC-2 type transport system ATP-binding protein